MMRLFRWLADRLPRRCGACHGHGRVTVWMAGRDGDRYPVWLECWRCDGWGISARKSDRGG